MLNNRCNFTKNVVRLQRFILYTLWVISKLFCRNNLQFNLSLTLGVYTLDKNVRGGVYLKVLIIDDEVELNNTVKKILVNQNYDDVLRIV